MASKRPVRVEYDSKIAVNASDTGLILLLGGLGVLGFGYLAYKALLSQQAAAIPESGSSGPSNTVTSAAQNSVLGQASTSANAPGAINDLINQATFIGVNANE